MLIYLSFQTVQSWQLAVIDTNASQLDHVCETPYFHVGKIIIWPQVVDLKMF